MEYVTTFSTGIFSLPNNIIYFHKAVQELQRNHETASFASFLYSVIGAVGTFLLAVALSTTTSWRPLSTVRFHLRLSEYAVAISIILLIWMPHNGELATLDKQSLVVQTSFRQSSPDLTIFSVQFWSLPVEWILLSIKPGVIITILFFSHEISSIIYSLDRYGTKISGHFAWGATFLGMTTAICGIIGISAANGLLP
jgi:hypothetical protein